MHRGRCRRARSPAAADPGEAANIGSVSQNWVNEHRVGRTEDGLR